MKKPKRREKSYTILEIREAMDAAWGSMITNELIAWIESKLRRIARRKKKRKAR